MSCCEGGPTGTPYHGHAGDCPACKVKVTPAPFHVTCPHCGSPNVCADAAARWSFATQEWEMVTTYDDRTCDDCGYDGHSFDETIEADLTPAQRATIDDGADYVKPAA